LVSRSWRAKSVRVTMWPSTSMATWEVDCPVMPPPRCMPQATKIQTMKDAMTAQRIRSSRDRRCA